MHGSASRNSQQAPLKIGTADFCGDPASSTRFPTARTARKMCNLALADAGIKRFSTVIQRFRLPISPHDQRRWRRDGWAVCPVGAFRPKLLKEMRRVARLARCVQSAEIRASPVRRSRDAQMCIVPVDRR